MLQVPALYKSRGFNKKLPLTPPTTPQVTGPHDHIKIKLYEAQEESSGLNKQQQTSGTGDLTNKEIRKK